MSRYHMQILHFLGLLFLFFIWNTAHAADSQRIETIQAEFTQEKHLKILSRPLISKGTFSFVSPGSLRWEYLSPVPSLLLMKDGKIKKYLSRDGKLVEDKSIQLDAMAVMLGEISNWLDGNFSENKMFTVHFEESKNVVLRPKSESMSGLIEKIELKLAETSGLLDSVTLFEGVDSFTTFTFNNRRLNKPIPESTFVQ